jgi:hypothetical protein
MEKTSPEMLKLALQKWETQTEDAAREKLPLNFRAGTAPLCDSINILGDQGS